MGAMSFRLAGFSALAVALCVAWPSPPARAQSAATIDNPTINGMAVDRCLTYAQNCDDPPSSTFPASTAYCQAHGFTTAVGSTWAFISQTYVQGDGNICNTPNGCGGFTQIICQ